MKLFCETSSIFELDNVKNAAILSDFLNFWSWQRQKRSNSARLSQFSKLARSKTKQFCETSFKNGTECRADGLVPMRFAFFPLHLSKVLHQPRKSDARSYEVLHLSRKIIFPKLTIWCSKMQPSQEISALISYLMCLLYCACQAQCIFPDPLQISHACHGCWNCYKTLQFCSLLTRCTIPCACHEKRHLNVQKCSVPLSFCAFDFEMCFVHNGVCSFPHLNFQKWSDPGVFRAFWLGHVLCATTACKFSSLIWPDGSATTALASLLFDHPEPQIIGKTHCFAAFLPFRAPGSSFFGDFLFFDLLSSSLLFSDSSHLCFSSVHIVGSLTSKLPSIMRLNLMFLAWFDMIYPIKTKIQITNIGVCSNDSRKPRGTHSLLQ